MVTTTIKDIPSSLFALVKYEDGNFENIITVPKIVADFITDGTLYSRLNADRTVDIATSSYVSDDSPSWNVLTKRFLPAQTSIFANNLTNNCVTTPKLASGAITGTTFATSGTGVVWVGNGTIITALAMGANGRFLQVVASNLIWSTVAGGSGGASTQEAEINWGTTTKQVTFSASITDSDSAIGQRVIGGVAFTTLSGKSKDEFEMDSFETKFQALTGSVQCMMRSQEGSFAGTVAIWYMRQ